MHPSGMPYRQENGFTLIEINLNRLDQLYNSFDPSPFHEKDLDADAEEYIVGAAREFPLHEKLKLVLYLLPNQGGPSAAPDVARGIQAYFGYRVHETKRKLRFVLRNGRISLMIGLTFLAACISLRQIFFADGEDVFAHIFSEGLVILGWVAMWRPLDTVLYEWWPHTHMARIYAKLAAMPVEIRPTGGSPVSQEKTGSAAA